MNCLLKLFSICLFDPSGVALEADLSWQVSGPLQYSYYEQGALRPYTGAGGRFALSVEVPAARGFDLRYGIEHRSQIEITEDAGEERAFVGVIWKPFRR
jgi:hypothetical protein